MHRNENINENILFDLIQCNPKISLFLMMFILGLMYLDVPPDL